MVREGFGLGLSSSVTLFTGADAGCCRSEVVQSIADSIAYGGVSLLQSQALSMKECSLKYVRRL